MIQVVWFKRDLRTVDHRPLAGAAKAGPVLPLYVAEPDYWASPTSSMRQWKAIAPTLEELSNRLTKLGGPLIIRIGSVVEILSAIHERHGISRLLAHEETGDWHTFERDKAVRRFCRATGIEFVEYPQFGVKRAMKDRNQWAKLHAAYMKEPLIREPSKFSPVPNEMAGRTPEGSDLGLTPDGCEEPQLGTRHEALGRLHSFFAGRGMNYRKGMSSPLSGETVCSRLSVPLSTGSISIRELIKRCNFERIDLGRRPAQERPIPITAIDSLLSRLHWHCHFIQKLESEPEMQFRSQHPDHERARPGSRTDTVLLEAWANGRTGFPFVDACMRSLIKTGWLNFRMRAMVQAFASYHLNLDWQRSGNRLARLFTDYEPGIHWPQVQMQGGQTGINVPRIYNPVKQGLDHDPDGIFIRRWVPELLGVQACYLHEPWRMDLLEQKRAGCVLGMAYPMPLVDHEVAARAARERLAQVRRRPGYRDVSRIVYARHGSRARRFDDDDAPRTVAVQRDRLRQATRQLALDL